MKALLVCDGHKALRHDEIFPSASEILDQLEDNNNIFYESHTRANAMENNEYVTFHGYLLSGSIDDAMSKCHNEFVSIIDKLCESLESQLNPLVTNPVFKAIAIVLDAESYSHYEFEYLFEQIQCIADHFNHVLVANGCQTRYLKLELEVVRDHIIKFLPHHSPVKCWPIIFKIANELDIRKILHIYEISLVTPL